MKYRFIESCAERLPVEGLCNHLGVARSGYYKWHKQEPGRRAQDDEQLGAVIEAEFYKHRKTYGSPRMCDRLRKLGRRHGRRRVSRLMAERALIARKTKRFVRTTIADPTKQPAPNVLNREFTAEQPNTKWVSDITEIPTDEGALYLAVTLDLWSRMIVGCARDDGRRIGAASLRHGCATALARSRLVASLRSRLAIHSQYTANGFRGQLRHRQVVESNSRKGNVWDTPDGRGLTPRWSRSFHLSKWSCFGSNTSRPKPKRYRRCSSTSKSSTIVNAFTQRWVTAARPSSRRRAETNLPVH